MGRRAPRHGDGDVPPLDQATVAVLPLLAVTVSPWLAMALLLPAATAPVLYARERMQQANRVIEQARRDASRQAVDEPNERR